MNKRTYSLHMVTADGTTEAAYWTTANRAAALLAARESARNSSDSDMVAIRVISSPAGKDWAADGREIGQFTKAA